MALGRELGFGAEIEWLGEILGWPLEWSALHGIAEIKTPVLRASARTDATPRKYVVRWEGESYPEGGASGLRFPSLGRAVQNSPPPPRSGGACAIPLRWARLGRHGTGATTALTRFSPWRPHTLR